MSARAALLALVLAAAAAVGAAAKPIEFDGDAYLPAAGEKAPGRIAQHFLRQGEDPARFSRRLTIADQLDATSARQIASGVVAFARLRTPGLEPGVFAAEGAEDRDVTVAWFVLTDDGAAVEFHVARFVALPGGRGRAKGVREYHMVAREYLNGREPDATLEAFVPVVAVFSDAWIEALQRLDRAPKP